MGAETVGAVALLLLAIAHSGLGEANVIGPLLGADWEAGMSRPTLDRILRGAWHLPSLAWVALAVVLVNGPLWVGISLAAGVPGVVLFLRMRAHLAWPLFLLAAASAMWADGVIGREVTVLVAVASVLVLAVAAAMHVYWALGGRRLAEAVLPMRPDGGARVSVPRPWMTLTVAVLLGGFAVLLAAVTAGAESTLLRALVAIGAVLLAARAVGDNRYAGFTKSVRSTAFAVADDRYLTPTVVFLTFGCVAALLVG